MLAGVLVDADADADGVTFVATDRYRMAIHRVPATVDGPAVRVTAPVSWVDRLREHPERDEPVVLQVRPADIEASGGGWTITDTPLAYDYPDYRRAVHGRTAGANPSRALVDAAALRALVGGAPRVVHTHEGVDHELAVLTIGTDGGIGVVGPDDWRAGPDRHVAVNREFLLQALNAGGDGQLSLELDGPIRPLAIRQPADDRSYSLLMPVRP
jgi:DNA polymerase III sliding clamp (beta) subunit (PCNA family)